MITRFAGLASLLTAAASLSAATAAIEGVVYVREGPHTSPLPGAFVSARSNAGARFVTRTDRSGRYRLPDLPPGQITVKAVKPGYHAQGTAKDPVSEVQVNCAVECSAAEADFVLVRASVLSGTVADELGEPVEGARIRLVSTTGADTDEKQSEHTAATDDRGRFRLSELPAGRYSLTASWRWGGDTFGAGPVPIALAEGQELDAVQLIGELQAGYEVAGMVQGLGETSGTSVIRLQDLSGNGRNYSSRLDENQRFAFREVRAGRYLTMMAPRGGEQRFLDVLTVHGDLTNLALSPRPTGAVHATVQFTGEAAPEQLSLRVESVEGFGMKRVRAGSPDFGFQLSGLVPGEYRVETEGGGFHVTSVESGSGEAGTDRVVVPGGELQVTIQVSPGEAP